MEALKVAIVDDNENMLKVLGQVIGQEQDLSVVGTATNGEDTFHIIKEKEPDVVLLDIIMPGESGIQLLRFLQKNYPDLPVLMLSTLTSAGVVQEAIQIGAKGFLSKSTDEEEFIEAIESVYEGAPYYGKDIAQILYDVTLSKSLKQEILTPREQEIVSLCSEGITCSQIADRLHISVRTVDTHKTAIFRKLDIHSSVELVRYALSHGIITL